MSTSKADLLECIAHLSDEKRALLEVRLAEIKTGKVPIFPNSGYWREANHCGQQYVHQAAMIGVVI